jgi:hypothetical protein
MRYGIEDQSMLRSAKCMCVCVCVRVKVLTILRTQIPNTETDMRSEVRNCLLFGIRDAVLSQAVDLANQM